MFSRCFSKKKSNPSHLQMKDFYFTNDNYMIEIKKITPEINIITNEFSVANENFRFNCKEEMDETKFDANEISATDQDQATESKQENTEIKIDVNEFSTTSDNQENAEIIIDIETKTVEYQQETAVTPVNSDSDVPVPVPVPDPNEYKATFAKHFEHDDIIKLKAIVGDMPYKTERWYYDVMELSIKEIGELADAYWRAKNFLIALKYYIEAAFLCIEQKKNSNEFYRKLYGIRNYFDDFPDLKEEIHHYLYSIEKYENNGSRKKSKEHYPSIKSSYERLLRIIDLEDLSDAIAADPQLAPVFPNSPPEIKDFINLFFNWIYKNDLGKFFSNQYSIPSLSDTVYMRAYERLLWVFKAKLLNAITGTSIGDGHLLLKMAYAIQKSNECLASEFAKKAATVYKEFGSRDGTLSVQVFFGECFHMNEFEYRIFEEPEKPKTMFCQVIKAFKCSRLFNIATKEESTPRKYLPEFSKDSSISFV